MLSVRELKVVAPSVDGQPKLLKETPPNDRFQSRFGEILNQGENTNPLKAEHLHGCHRDSRNANQPTGGRNRHLNGFGNLVAKIDGVVSGENTVGRARVNERIDLFDAPRSVKADRDDRRDGNREPDLQ